MEEKLRLFRREESPARRAIAFVYIAALNVSQRIQTKLAHLAKGIPTGCSGRYKRNQRFWRRHTFWIRKAVKCRGQPLPLRVAKDPLCTGAQTTGTGIDGIYVDIRTG
jgi:hypothetical protein